MGCFFCCGPEQIIGNQQWNSFLSQKKISFRLFEISFEACTWWQHWPPPPSFYPNKSNLLEFCEGHASEFFFSPPTSNRNYIPHYYHGWTENFFVIKTKWRVYKNPFWRSCSKCYRCRYTFSKNRIGCHLVRRAVHMRRLKFNMPQMAKVINSKLSYMRQRKLCGFIA